MSFENGKCPVCNGSMPAGNRFCGLVCYYIKNPAELMDKDKMYQEAMQKKVETKKESLQQEGVGFFG
jgi:hypothetical protein